MFFRKNKVRTSIAKIGLGSMMIDGSIQPAEVTAMAIAIANFNFFRELDPEKRMHFIQKGLQEIKKASAEERFVEEIARSCVILKKNSEEASTAFAIALFIALSDGELRGNEVAYIEMLKVNLHITKEQYAGILAEIKAIADRVKESINEKEN